MKVGTAVVLCLGCTVISGVTGMAVGASVVKGNSNRVVVHDSPRRRPTASASQRPTPSRGPDFEAGSVSCRVVERSGDYVSYGWAFDAKNNTGSASTGHYVKVQFLDASGMQVGMDNEITDLPAGTTRLTQIRSCRAEI